MTRIVFGGIMIEFFDFAISLVSKIFKGALGIFLIIVIVLGFLLVAFRTTCVNFVDNYELGYKFDKRTGEIAVLDRTGFFITPPFLVSVHTIDLRPMQVCISANRRVLNCKLVEFDPAGLQLFLSWHGRGNYYGPGNTPSSSGQSSSGNSVDTTKTPFSEILMVYAFDETKNTYPFLKIHQGTAPTSSGASASSTAEPPPVPNTTTMVVPSVEQVSTPALKTP